MKKYIKTAIYLLFAIFNVILITRFVRITHLSYEEGLIFGIQYYTRIICGFVLYCFIFIHILLLILEHTRRMSHSLWWEAISLIILFIAFIANIL
jgi:hypothetical protein